MDYLEGKGGMETMNRTRLIVALVVVVNLVLAGVLMAWLSACAPAESYEGPESILSDGGAFSYECELECEVRQTAGVTCCWLECSRGRAEIEPIPFNCLPLSETNLR